MNVTTSRSTLQARIATLACLVIGPAVLVACSRANSAEHAAAPAANVVAAQPTANKSAALSAVAELGRKMFFDPSLSASGSLACASCHSPTNAYAPPNKLSVQLGGPDMKLQGGRAVPSLRYLEHTPNFSIGPSASVPDNDAPPAAPVVANNVGKVATVAKNTAAAAIEANVPQGGLDWDGRMDTLQDQALGPLLDPHEMANHDAADVLKKLERAAYADDMRKLFGPQIFRSPDLALSEALFALTRFQLEDKSFHPYDSKYDFYLAGKAKLSEQETRGLKLFEDPKKGNCSSCHIDKTSRDGKFPPAFTDYQYESLGAPRNKEIAANRDPRYYDLGLCGPTRKDYVKVRAYCGLFKTPTLRNVATRGAFFHNGVFHSLDDVLHFYVERETQPGKWYPKHGGRVDKYNDMPQRYRGNVDVADAPFDRHPGDAPALDDAEIADVIAFLKTLDDGYQPEAAKH